MIVISSVQKFRSFIRPDLLNDAVLFQEDRLWLAGYFLRKTYDYALPIFKRGIKAFEHYFYTLITSEKCKVESFIHQIRIENFAFKHIDLRMDKVINLVLTGWKILSNNRYLDDRDQRAQQQ